MTRSSAASLSRNWEWLWLRWLLNKQQSCLPLSLGSNISVTTSRTDGTDLWRDGQAELAVWSKTSPRTGRGWSVGREQLWILRGFESVTAFGVTSKIRFLLKSLQSFYSYAGFVLVNCTTDLSIVLVIIDRCCLSCIRSVAKLYTAIHERFGHVSHSSLKRVVTRDSALFLMSIYKTSYSLAQLFLLSWLRGRFFLQVAASLVMMFFVENYHR